MLYVSERNYGCRFLEVTLYGFRTLIIENKYIRTMILIDKGADIVELLYKPTDTDFIWKNPMGLSCLKKMRGLIGDEEILSDNYLGGWFEILPNVGSACTFRNKRFSANSEVSSLPFEYSVLCDTPEKLTLKFFARLSKYPFLLEKTLTITQDSPSLFFEERITNLGLTPLEYQWGHHPNIGGQFLDENCVIDFPECKITNFDKDKLVKDIFQIPPRGSMENHLVNLTGFKKGFGAFRNKKTGLGIGFCWDEKVFTSCALWISANNDCGHHHHDGAYVACLLPKNTDEFCLDKAVEKGQAPLLQGKESITARFTATVFQSNQKVTGIDFDGIVSAGEVK